MEGARVGIFEDNENWQEIVPGMVTRRGHEVVLQAQTLEDAEAAIERLPANGLDVAVVDGNLDPNVSSGEDGARITRLLHEKFEGITVIGRSGSKEVEGADHQLGKGGDLSNLPQIIAEL